MPALLTRTSSRHEPYKHQSTVSKKPTDTAKRFNTTLDNVCRSVWITNIAWDCNDFSMRMGLLDLLFQRACFSRSSLIAKVVEDKSSGAMDGRLLCAGSTNSPRRASDANDFPCE